MASADGGVDGFIAGLDACAVFAQISDGLVIFELEPVTGGRAGTTVTTAVEAAELQRWPAVPPHWIHVPDDITFAQTNSRPSTRPGFLRHSRQIGDWGRDSEPGRAWLSHHRAVLGECTS